MRSRHFPRAVIQTASRGLQMSTVGVIANPAAGKDIRRIVAQGRFIPNHEKVNILKRALVGMDAVGVERVLFLPDSGGLGRSALQDTKLDLTAEFVEMTVFHAEIDTSRAAKAMLDAGVNCIITLGGDGTNRAVATECGDIPLVPISTGTNNVFPTMLEGTIAGMAAGVVATGQADPDRSTIHHNRLEVYVDGHYRDMALVDVAVSTERFVGARAIWDMSTLHQLFLTRASVTSIGLSAIGAQLKQVAPDSPEGLYVRLGTGGETVLAPVAPGSVTSVDIAEWSTITPSGPGIEVDLRPSTIALDGERAFSLSPSSSVEVRLGLDGPRVVDPDRALALATESGGLALARRSTGSTNRDS